MDPFLTLFNNESVKMKNENNDFRSKVTEAFGEDIFGDSDVEVLILTRRDDPEADILGIELASNNINYLRLNIDEFPQYKFSVYLLNNNNVEVYVQGKYTSKISLNKTKVVIYRRFGIGALNKEVVKNPIHQKYISKEWELFLNALTNLLDAKWINHPFTSRSYNNFYQLKIASDLGLKIPNTIVSNNPKDIEGFYNKTKNQIIAKTIDSHFILYNNVHYAIWGKMLQREDFVKHSDSMTVVPVVYQDFYEGCKEIRVTVVGDKVFGTQFDNNVVGDWHRSDRKYFNCSVHNLPSNIENACVEYLKKLNFVYGAFDFLLTDKNEYIFLELNSYGDWRWIENITKQPITQTIIDYCKEVISNEKAKVVKYSGKPNSTIS